MNPGTSQSGGEPQPWQRLYSLGGSDVAAALGLSPWKSPITLWQELRGELQPQPGNERTRWGQILEPVIRAEYVERNGVAVHVPPEPLVHPKHEWMHVRPDGIVVDGETWVRGLEIKAVGLRMEQHWEDGVPALYELQCRWGMAIADLPRWDVPVLIGGQEYREYVLERDAELEEAILEEAAAFWRLVEEGRPPDPDDTDEYKEYLIRRYAKPRKEYLQASVELDQSIGRYLELRELCKELEAERKQIENELHAAIGDAAGLEASDCRVSLVRVKGRTTVDYKAAFEDLCERVKIVDPSTITEKHTKQGAPHRRLQIKETKQ